MVPTVVPDSESLPEALLAHDQWLCWREQERDGKPTKVPIDPTVGGYGSATDPTTWTDFATACEYARTGEADGLGFVFTDADPFVGVDLDDCRDPDARRTDAWAAAVIEQLDSFTEISPSGTGFHVIVRGSLPDGRNRSGDIELYETARFFTVTGDHVPDTPTSIHDRPDALRAVYDEHVAPDDADSAADAEESPASNDAPGRDGDGGPGTPAAAALTDEELLSRARTAANGAKFQRLWTGDTSGYESHSEADMALCSLLAFWTGGDGTRMDRLFRQSGLMREKWDEVHYSDGRTYGETTIQRAIAGTDECYEPSSTETSTADQDRIVGDASPRQGSSVTPAGSQESQDQGDIDQFESVQALVREVQALNQANERLRAELEAEREHRQALEAELTATESTDHSLWHRFKRAVGLD